MIKPEKINTEIVKKNASAIHIDAKLSLIQRRISNALLFNAYDKLLTSSSHTIDIPTLCSLIGFEGKNHDHLKTSLKALASIPIEWNILDKKGKEIWGVSSLLASAEIKNGMCTYEYSSALAERLYNPEMYARINLAVQRKITSGHTLALYENCFRFIGSKSTGEWTLEKFRRLLGVHDDDYYKDFKRLNNKIIKPSVKEINKTSNIIIEPEFTKTGRRISHIKFHIKPNPQLSMVDIEERDEINQTKAYKSLLKKGISKILARQWIIEYGEEYILEKLAHTDKMEGAGRIKATASGFLTKAIQQDYKTEEAVNKVRVKELDDKRAQENEKARKLEGLTKQLRDLERSYRNDCANLIEVRYSEMSDTEQQKAREAFKQVLSGHAIALQRFVKDGWHSPLSSTQAREFWGEVYSLPLPSFEDYAKENGIKSVKAHKKKIKDFEPA